MASHPYDMFSDDPMKGLSGASRLLFMLSDVLLSLAVAVFLGGDPKVLLNRSLKYCGDR